MFKDIMWYIVHKVASQTVIKIFNSRAQNDMKNNSHFILLTRGK